MDNKINHDYITLDFETRSECELRSSGAWAYAEHDTTKILCMAYKIADEEEKIWKPHLGKDVEGEPLPQDIVDAINSGMIVEAHNAEFEQALWKHKMVEEFGAPEVPIEQWRCSMAKCAAAALPQALGNAGEALGLPITKDEEGRKIMMQLARTRVPSAANPDKFWEPETAPEKFEILWDYCLVDVAGEVCLSGNVPDLSDEEQQIWFLDQKINQRGINVDMKSIESFLWCIDRLTERIDRKTVEITNGALSSVRKRDAFIKYITGLGYELPDAKKQTIERWLKKDDLPEDVMTLIKYRNVLSKTTTKKFQSMLDRAQSDGRIRGTLMYHGASTGRWSGRGVQPQNLPRGNEKDIDDVIASFSEQDIDKLVEKYPNPFDAAASCIRAMIIPTEGYDFYCADFSSIEARCLVWLAGDERALELFREDKDVYIDMAAAIYKVPVDEVTPEQRQVGKMAILGLGYGMGWATFKKNSKNMGAAIEEDFAKAVVKTYREKYASVASYWKQLENVAMAAVKNPEKVVRLGHIAYCYMNDFLSCKLPSGRIIRYYKPSIQPRVTSWGATQDTLCYYGVDAYTRKWQEQTTYGGKLVENVTQAVARDFMAAGMLRIDAAGYDIVLTVHDELLAESNNPDHSIEEFETLMSTIPDWAEGCPIAAEGWKGKRYKK